MLFLQTVESKNGTSAKKNNKSCCLYIGEDSYCDHHEKLQTDVGHDILEGLKYFVVELLVWTTTFNLFVFLEMLLFFGTA